MNIFTPSAQPALVVRNFETGLCYSASDVFINLFSSKRFTTQHFRSVTDEWEAENYMKQELCNMVFGNPYSIGSEGKTASESDISTFKKEIAEMTQHLLYSSDSILREFKKKGFRKMLSDGRLNIEAVKELFNISQEFPQSMIEWASGFSIDGESGDWYFTNDKSGSCAFGETRLLTIAKFITEVLNVQERLTSNASRRLSEGFDRDEVRKELEQLAFGVSELVDTAMDSAKVEEVPFYVFMGYNQWTTRRASEYTLGDGEQFYKLPNYREAVQFAYAKNKALNAEAKRKENLEKIEGLQNELARCLSRTDEFDNKVDEANSKLIEAENLARFL